MKNNRERSAAILLKDVSGIWQKYDKLNRKSGLKYNIFNIAQIKNKELIICRVIADLLNPNGTHYKGNVYLKLLMDLITPRIKKTGEFDLSKAQVSTEYTINENRRIDIAIEDGNIFIPIEVKIYAGDQEKQITDYATFSRKKNTAAGFIPVIFLTLDGHEPSQTNENDYICFSFKEHIIPWLNKCLLLKETEKTPPIKEIIKQLMGAVKSLCEVEDEEMENEINKLITQSDDSLKAALLIKHALESEELDFDQKAYNIFWDKIFNLVHSKIGSAGRKEEDDWWYINIPIRKDYNLCINYDWKSIGIWHTDDKKSANADEADKIRKTMSALTGNPDAMWEGAIWASENTLYPGLEKTEDGLYLYELCRIYSTNTQAVVEKIISMVNALENI
jgi:hypothetical protein